MFRVEQIPIFVAIVVALLGVLIIADAVVPEAYGFLRERRRSSRRERSVAGEACIGLSVLSMSAVLFGRDSWPYVNVVMMAAAALLVAGLAMNWHYLRERITNRGELRRK